VAQAAANRGQPVHELLALLHAAIQKQQRYPLSAQQMAREGRVTVVFILLPSGQIQQVRIMQSSGTASLDEAALMAVRDAAPFQQVDKYLQTAKEYSVDVVFTLV
jgi:protein TonB